MKKLFLILGISINMFFIAGCAEKELVIKKKILYIHTPIPNISKKPEFIPYQASIVELDKKKYYLIDLKSGIIMVDNFRRFKLWSMQNYIILNNLRKDYLKSIKKD